MHLDNVDVSLGGPVLYARRSSSFVFISKECGKRILAVKRLNTQIGIARNIEF